MEIKSDENRLRVKTLLSLPATEITPPNPALHNLPKPSSTGIPLFTGKNVSEWIDRKEQVFSSNSVPPDSKLFIAEFYLAGEPLRFLYGLLYASQLSTWERFVSQLELRFGNSIRPTVIVNVWEAGDSESDQGGASVPTIEEVDAGMMVESEVKLAEETSAGNGNSFVQAIDDSSQSSEAFSQEEFGGEGNSSNCQNGDEGENDVDAAGIISSLQLVDDNSVVLKDVSAENLSLDDCSVALNDVSADMRNLVGNDREIIAATLSSMAESVVLNLSHKSSFDLRFLVDLTAESDPGGLRSLYSAKGVTCVLLVLSKCCDALGTTLVRNAQICYGMEIIYGDYIRNERTKGVVYFLNTLEGEWPIVGSFESSEMGNTIWSFLKGSRMFHTYLKHFVHLLSFLNKAAVLIKWKYKRNCNMITGESLSNVNCNPLEYGSDWLCFITMGNHPNTFAIGPGDQFEQLKGSRERFSKGELPVRAKCFHFESIGSLGSEKHAIFSKSGLLSLNLFEDAIDRCCIREGDLLLDILGINQLVIDDFSLLITGFKGGTVLYKNWQLVGYLVIMFSFSWSCNISMLNRIDVFDMIKTGTIPALCLSKSIKWFMRKVVVGAYSSQAVRRWFRTENGISIAEKNMIVIDHKSLFLEGLLVLPCARFVAIRFHPKWGVDLQGTGLTEAAEAQLRIFKLLVGILSSILINHSFNEALCVWPNLTTCLRGSTEFCDTKTCILFDLEGNCHFARTSTVSAPLACQLCAFKTSAGSKECHLLEFHETETAATTRLNGKLLGRAMALFTSSNGAVLIELNCKHDDDDLDLFLSTSITANEGYLFQIEPGGLVHLHNSEMICFDRSWDKAITCFSGGTLFRIEADKPKLAIRVEHGDSLGSLNLVITVEEENFVWRIAWNMNERKMTTAGSSSAKFIGLKTVSLIVLRPDGTFNPWDPVLEKGMTTLGFVLEEGIVIAADHRDVLATGSGSHVVSLVKDMIRTMPGIQDKVSLPSEKRRCIESVSSVTKAADLAKMAICFTAYEAPHYGDVVSVCRLGSNGFEKLLEDDMEEFHKNMPRHRIRTVVIGEGW
ncbi:OLC1v1014868C1 [Oldenlandia corymbosa var. corymbosa]|uniref:OLC1v1014868C1 n=1 Tax=Oldenlandia corymbosa var. corymbosa TaxID=529605 RepID=A0AAV1E1Z9_OLDCO|nr:OLC1v1014868C1 [Oldenlandia corymbosa var. corymbosa]